MSYEVDFLDQNKHESFLQTDTMTFHGYGQVSPKVAISRQYLKKEVRYEVDFLHAVEHQSFLQVFNTLKWCSHTCCFFFYLSFIAIKDRINKMLSKYFNLQL